MVWCLPQKWEDPRHQPALPFTPLGAFRCSGSFPLHDKPLFFQLHAFVERLTMCHKLQSAPSNTTDENFLLVGTCEASTTVITHILQQQKEQTKNVVVIVCLF